MNIVIKELRSHLKALIIWCTSMVLLIYVGMVKYTGFVGGGIDISSLLKSYPEALITAMGLDKLDITQISGYYGVFFLYFLLIGTIHAAMLGATIISKEERDHTADFIYSKPVKRSEIITSKILAGVINIAVLNLITLISSIIFVGIYNEGESITSDILLLMFALFILQLFFFSLGAFISAITDKTKKATRVSTGILLGTFMLSVMIDLNDKIDFLKYFTPFKYFEAKTLITDGKIEIIYLLISLAVIIVSTVLTYKYYQRRDLRV